MSRAFVPRFQLWPLCAVLATEVILAAKIVDSETSPQAIIQNALEQLNNLASTQGYYKSAALTSIYPLTDSPQVTLKITLDLELNCNNNVDICPHETCIIEVQHRLGKIEIIPTAISCSPAEKMKDELSSKDESKVDKQQKQIQFIEEMDTKTDVVDKPFVAVKPSPQYCPGCPYELKPNVPGLWALGEEIVESMDQNSNSDFKYKVVEITKVLRSVPPNLNVIRYELIMEIGDSTCLKTSLIDRSECSLQPNVPNKLCSVTVDEKPWQEQNKRRIVKNNCTDSGNTLNELNVNNFEESSSNQEDDMQTYVKQEMYEYDQVAQEGKLTQAVSENESNSPIIEESPIQSMPNADNQMPDRFADKYKEFDQFLKDFEVPIREISTTPDPRIPVVEEYVKIELPSEDMVEAMAFRSKRQLSLLPTPEKIFLRKLAQIVVDILDGIDEDNDKRLVLDVLEAKKETQDESVYHFTLKVINTKCTEKEALDRKCMADLVGPTNICNVEVEVNSLRPLGPPKIRNSTCVEETQAKHTPRHKREHLVGGRRQIDTSDSKVQKYATLALSEYNDKHNDGPNQVILIEILDATSQVVNGVNYGIKAKIGESNCTKSFTDNCQVKENIVPLICEFKLHVPINAGEVSLIKSDCGETTVQRTKRGLVGGKRKADINDPQIQEYAALGLSKYIELYEGPDQPILMEVTDAKTQVVSGMLYEITVKIGESDCKKGVSENCNAKQKSKAKTCLVTIWSQPWLDKGNPKVKVDCKENKFKRSLRGKNYSLKMQNLGKQWKEDELFQQFKSNYNKVYGSQEEENKRFQIFRQNLETIKELQRTEQGTGQYGPTQYADLTTEEFKQMHTGLKLKNVEENALPLANAKIPDIEIPNEFDWRHYNVVTHVKNQGSCGSCWAFSVTGNIESLYAIKHGKLVSLSEQELVDCDKFDEGCNGGLPSSAYEAIERLGGLETEKEYPYDATDEKCKFNKKMVAVEITSGLNITSNETQMAQWLVQNGPITIGINANAMQFYFGGISHPLKFLCNPKDLDHGVLIVGYGVKSYPIFHKVLPYWIIKNSWGPNWGEQGYYRVYRGDGTCGVNSMPTSAVVA